MEHQFTSTILSIVREDVGEHGDVIYQQSELLRYLNEKTRSASRGSKSRSAFGNLYALYVLVEDYVRQGFPTRGAATTASMKAPDIQTCSIGREDFPSDHYFRITH